MPPAYRQPSGVGNTSHRTASNSSSRQPPSHPPPPMVWNQVTPHQEGGYYAAPVHQTNSTVRQQQQQQQPSRGTDNSAATRQYSNIDYRGGATTSSQQMIGGGVQKGPSYRSDAAGSTNYHHYPQTTSHHGGIDPRQSVASYRDGGASSASGASHHHHPTVVVSHTSDQFLTGGRTSSSTAPSHRPPPIRVPSSFSQQQGGGGGIGVGELSSYYRPVGSNTSSNRPGVYEGVASYQGGTTTTTNHHNAHPPMIPSRHSSSIQQSHSTIQQQHPTSGVIATTSSSSGLMRPPHSSTSPSMPRSVSPAKLPVRVQNKVEERRRSGQSPAPSAPRSRATSLSPSVNHRGDDAPQSNKPSPAEPYGDPHNRNDEADLKSNQYSSGGTYAPVLTVNGSRSSPPPQPTPKESPFLSSSSKAFSMDVVRVSSQNSSLPGGACGGSGGAGLLNVPGNNQSAHLRMSSTSTALPHNGGSPNTLPSASPTSASLLFHNEKSGESSASFVNHDVSMVQPPVPANSPSTRPRDERGGGGGGSVAGTNSGDMAANSQRLADYLHDQYQNTLVQNRSDLLEPAGSPESLSFVQPREAASTTTRESTGPLNTPALLCAPILDNQNSGPSSWSDSGEALGGDQRPVAPASTPTRLPAPNTNVCRDQRRPSSCGGGLGVTRGDSTGNQPPTPPASPAALSVRNPELASFEGSISHSFCAAPPGTPQALSTRQHPLSDGSDLPLGIAPTVINQPPTPPASPAALSVMHPSQIASFEGSISHSFCAAPPGTPQTLSTRQHPLSDETELSVGRAIGSQPPTPPASPAALSVMHPSHLASFEGSISQSFCAAPPGTPQALSTSQHPLTERAAPQHGGLGVRNFSVDTINDPPSSPAWGVYRSAQHQADKSNQQQKYSATTSRKSSTPGAPPTPPSSPAWGVAAAAARQNVRNSMMSEEDLQRMGNSGFGGSAYPADPPSTPAQLSVVDIHSSRRNDIQQRQRNGFTTDYCDEDEGQEGVTSQSNNNNDDERWCSAPASSPISMRPLQPATASTSTAASPTFASAPANTPVSGSSFSADPTGVFNMRNQQQQQLDGSSQPRTPANTPTTLRPSSNGGVPQSSFVVAAHPSSPAEPPTSPAMGGGGDVAAAMNRNNTAPYDQIPSSLAKRRAGQLKDFSRTESEEEVGSKTPMQPLRIPDAAVGNKRVGMPTQLHQQHQHTFPRNLSVSSASAVATPPSQAPSPLAIKGAQQVMRRTLRAMAGVMERESTSKCIWAAWHKWSRFRQRSSSAVVSMTAVLSSNLDEEDTSSTINSQLLLQSTLKDERSSSPFSSETLSRGGSRVISSFRGSPSTSQQSHFPHHHHTGGTVLAAVAPQQQQQLPPLGRGGVGVKGVGGASHHHHHENGSKAVTTAGSVSHHIDPATATASSSTIRRSASSNSLHSPLNVDQNTAHHSFSPTGNFYSEMQQQPRSPRGQVAEGSSSREASQQGSRPSPALSPKDYLRRRKDGVRTDCVNEELKAAKTEAAAIQQQQEAQRRKDTTMSPIAALRHQLAGEEEGNGKLTKKTNSGDSYTMYNSSMSQQYTTPTRNNINRQDDSITSSAVVPPPLPLQSPGAQSVTTSNNYNHNAANVSSNVNSSLTAGGAVGSRSVSNASNNSGGGGGSYSHAVSRTQSFDNPFMRPEEYLRGRSGVERSAYDSMVKQFGSSSYDPERSTLEKNMVSSAEAIAEEMRVRARHMSQEYLSSPERLREMRELLRKGDGSGGGRRTDSNDEGEQQHTSATTAGTTAMVAMARTVSNASSTSTQQLPRSSSVVPTPAEYSRTRSGSQRYFFDQ